MNRPESAQNRVLVTGAAGRIGRLLQAIWGDKLTESLPILWQARVSQAGAGVSWDIGRNPPPYMPEGMVVLHLAGKVAGSAEDLAENATVTRAVCGAARAARARHVFVMSTAAVYAPGPVPLTESAPPGPVNPYGASKLAAEAAAVAELAGSETGLTLLRLANLAGADALLGAARAGQTVTLDPIAGQAGGPERSYIGPRVLAEVLAELLQRAVAGQALPQVVNVAQQPPVAMADLLTAKGQAWRFGAPRAGAVARVVLNTDRLAGIMPVPRTDAAALIADLGSVPGWMR